MLCMGWSHVLLVVFNLCEEPHPRVDVPPGDVCDYDMEQVCVSRGLGCVCVCGGGGERRWKRQREDSLYVLNGGGGGGVGWC